MTQEEQVQFVLDVTARLARSVIQEIRDGELNDYGKSALSAHVEDRLEELKTWE